MLLCTEQLSTLCVLYNPLFRLKKLFSFSKNMFQSLTNVDKNHPTKRSIVCENNVLCHFLSIFV